jgi:hypothetical protein
MIAGFTVLVLLLVQINALRYQSGLINWVQRAWLFTDLVALVLFFCRNALRAPEPRNESKSSQRRLWVHLLWLRVVREGCASQYRRWFFPPVISFTGSFEF